MARTLAERDCFSMQKWRAAALRKDGSSKLNLTTPGGGAGTMRGLKEPRVRVFNKVLSN